MIVNLIDCFQASFKNLQSNYHTGVNRMSNLLITDIKQSHEIEVLNEYTQANIFGGKVIRTTTYVQECDNSGKNCKTVKVTTTVEVK